MVGYGLKKLARENGMNVSKGIAYGSLRGYAATMSEGAGWKKIAFSVKFTDAAQMGSFIDASNSVDVKKLYRVSYLGITSKTVVAVFIDNPGTMKKIVNFLDWIVPLFDQYSATKIGTCPHCDGQVTDGSWKLIGDVAHYMHSTCAEYVCREVAAENENRRQDAVGSYALGLVGALIGAAIGAVVWAVVLNMGILASLVGLLIGFLAEKGYNLFRGKQGKGKVAVLIIAIIVGVVLGTVGADVFALVSMVAKGETYITYSDIPGFLLMLFAEDAEYASAVAYNVLVGFLFAGLGVFALLRKAGKEVADIKIIDLQ